MHPRQQEDQEIEEGEEEVTCRHEAFATTAKITRVTDHDGGEVKNFALELTVQCDQCGIPFVFKGLQAGMAFSSPRVSALGEEARLPIEPMGEEDLDIFTAIKRTN